MTGGMRSKQEVQAFCCVIHTSSIVQYKQSNSHLIQKDRKVFWKVHTKSSTMEIFSLEVRKQ